MSRIDLPKIYNPAQQPPLDLIDNFVVRTDLFREIFNDIKKSEMVYPEQHYIIQGVRGQGKTTMLLRIAYEIQRDPELRQRLIPVIFNEEQYNISKLYKLWETVAEYLDESGEMGASIHQQMQNLDYQDPDYEQACFELIEQALIQHKKKALLFIDNIDEMLDKFSKREHHRLREIFTESPEIRIIGASSVSLEFHHDHSKPFYQFFKMPRLKGLNTKETETLLLGLGTHYKIEKVKHIITHQSGRIEALRRLTGGVIRTIIILFEIFVDEKNGNALKDLEVILDGVTPLFKHRMDTLTAQQQEIVDFIALSWDAVSAGEIARKTKLASKAVSAQLGQLIKYNIVEKEKTTTKNFLYRIHERFFNIWYLMRLGRKWDEKRVRFIVEFLQLWCEKKELEKRAIGHLDAIHKKAISDRHALFITEALIRTEIEPPLQSRLVEATRTYLFQCGSELQKKISLPESVHETPQAECVVSDEFTENIQAIKDKKEKSADELNELGISSFMSEKNVGAAKSFFLSAIDKGHAGAMFNLALLYQTEFKDFDNAKQYYLMASDKGHASAMNNLAGVYFENKTNKEEALKLSRNAYEKKVDNTSANTYAMVLLWTNHIDEAVKIAGRFLNDHDYLENYPEGITQFLLLLIAKQQFHHALKIFQETPHGFIDRFKPVYYALMRFMQKEYPNEHLRMGAELKETVDEITQKIEELKADY